MIHLALSLQTSSSTPLLSPSLTSFPIHVHSALTPFRLLALCMVGSGTMCSSLYYLFFFKQIRWMGNANSTCSHSSAPTAVLQSMFSYQAQALTPQAATLQDHQTGCTVYKQQRGDRIDSSCESPTLVFRHLFPKSSISSTYSVKCHKQETKFHL